jgi:prepilin-type N-terminal cleavage/methylation domain-containing protein
MVAAIQRRARGFTLMEMLITVAIVGTLAGMSAVALNRMKSRGTFASATGDFLATLRTARAEAFARGNPAVVVVDSAAGLWWSVEDVNGDFSLASFDPAAPAPSPDRLLYSGRLPSGTSFGPQDGWGTALPQPYSGIPTGYVTIVLADGGSGGVADISADGGSSAPNFKYCSFCDTSSKRGAITFLPSGGASFSGGPLTIGQQISLQDISAPDGGVSGGPTGIIDFAVVAATGSTEAVTIR